MYGALAFEVACATLAFVAAARGSADLDALPELLVLVADELDRLVVGHDSLVDAQHKHTFGERFRVLERHVDLELAVDRTAEALDELRLIAIRRAAHVQPAVERPLFGAAQVVGFDDERVAVPASQRP